MRGISSSTCARVYSPVRWPLSSLPLMLGTKATMTGATVVPIKLSRLLSISPVESASSPSLTSSSGYRPLL